MLHKISEFHGVAIHATDDVLGTVRDVYFEDTDWTVRYFVVETGRWLSGRLVLLGHEAAAGLDMEERELRVNLTKEQVESSPGIETHEPVSRQYEMELRKYYGWPIYWPQGPSEVRGVQALRAERAEPHLRSASEVAGYYIHARDGEIGHVEDFIVDETSWRILSLIVDTRNWWPGKKVLITPQSIESIDWASSEVRVRLNRDAIRNGPEFDPSAPLEKQLDQELYQQHV